MSYTPMGRSNRDNWSTEIQSEKVAEGAKNKANYHRARLDFWKGRYDQIKNDASTKVSVHEGVGAKAAMEFSNSGRNIAAPTLVVDQRIQQDLTESYNKILEHKKRIQEYDSWVQMLSNCNSKPMTLLLDDYLFFFGEQVSNPDD